MGIVALALTSEISGAHPVSVLVSPDGLGFLGEQVPYLLSKTLTVPGPVTFDLPTCLKFTQRNTTAELWIEDVDLSLGPDSTLRVAARLGFSLTGEGTLENIYLCWKDQTCDDTFTIDEATLRADFRTSVGGDRAPSLSLVSFDVNLDPDDVHVHFSCGITGTVLSWVIGIAKPFVMDKVLAMAEDMAYEQLGPSIEATLRQFSTHSGSLKGIPFTASLTELVASAMGLQIGLDIDLLADGPPAPCVSYDPGEPPAHPGNIPDLTSGRRSQLAVAVNLGSLDDALYQLWRNGHMCVTSDALATHGIFLPLERVGDLFPVFPQGTTFSLKARLRRPPRVSSDGGAASATLTLALPGLQATLVATLPGGETRTVQMEIDAVVTAAAVLDPGINAVMLTVESVRIDRFAAEEDAGLDAAGFDFARLQLLVEDHVLPMVLQDLQRVPVSAAVFGRIAGSYALLREVTSYPGHWVAKLDLFRPPEFDLQPPETFVTHAPSGPVKPSDAILTVGGSDREIPPDLLQYNIRVNGVPRPATFLRRFTLGEAGVTSSYAVEISAVDLHGNVDPVPARADVLVDGTRPRVRLTEKPSGVIDTTTAWLAWTAMDDLTPEADLVPHILVTTLDPRGTQTPEVRQEVTLPAGTTETRLLLEPGTYARVSVTLYDQAGNRAAASTIFSVSEEAAHPEGCNVTAGGGPGSAIGWLFGLTFIALGRGLLSAPTTATVPNASRP
jgi:hypothetical protein